MSRIARLVDELRRAREADPELRIFGASTHGYRLNPAASEEAVARVEAATKQPLPEDYRAFLREAGNGGAGPYYGILSLETSLGRLAEVYGTEVLGHDFPHTADVDFGEALGQPADFDEHLARLEDDPDYAAGFDRMQAEYYEPELNGGMLPICDYGCGDFFQLVLRGTRRGTVWANCVEGATGLYCLEVDFLSFYEAWLDDALDRACRKDFRPQNASYSFLAYSRNPRYAPIPRSD